MTCKAIEQYVMPRQCYFEEVEVDSETGKIGLTKVVVVNDVGKLVDPESCNDNSMAALIWAPAEPSLKRFAMIPRPG